MEKYIMSVYIDVDRTYDDWGEHLLRSSLYEIEEDERTGTKYAKGLGGTSASIKEKSIDEIVKHIVEFPSDSFKKISLKDVEFKYEFLVTPGPEYIDYFVHGFKEKSGEQEIEQLIHTGLLKEKKMPEYLKSLIEKYGGKVA